MLLDMAADDVLDRCGGEEILLPQPQFLTGRIGIGGIEYPHQAVGAHLIGECPGMIAGVERVEPDRIQRGGSPKPQRVDPLAAPADHRGIDRRRLHLFRRMPGDAVAGLHHLAAEADTVRTFAPLELPRIAVRQPGFGQFDLPAIVDPLAEHAVHIADAVAIGRDAQAGEALHEAGGQPPEPAIAQRRVGFELLELCQIETVLAQGLLHLAGQPHVGHSVAEQASDEKFEAQIIDPLAAGIVGLASQFHPAVDYPVAQCQHGGGKPVVRLGGAFVLSDAVAQHIDDQRVGIGDRDGGGEGRSGGDRRWVGDWHRRSSMSCNRQASRVKRPAPAAARSSSSMPPDAWLRHRQGFGQGRLCIAA